MLWFFKIPLRAGLVLGTLWLLAACEAAPRPFEHQKTNPLLALATGNGIAVADISGLPAEKSLALSDAMTTELRRLELPATRGRVTRSSYLLRGESKLESDGSRMDVVTEWILIDRAGKIVQTYRGMHRVRQRDWKDSRPETFRKIVAAPAAMIAASLREAAGAVAGEQAGTADAPVKIALWPIAGAPEGGGRTLRRAVEAALRHQNFRIMRETDDTRLVLAGSVWVGPPTEGQREVDIRWSLLRDDGAELGNLRQRNMVAEDTFDRPWHALAAEIGSSAAAGLIELLDNLPEKTRTSLAAGGPDDLTEPQNRQQNR